MRLHPEKETKKVTKAFQKLILRKRQLSKRKLPLRTASGSWNMDVKEGAPNEADSDGSVQDDSSNPASTEVMNFRNV